MTFGRVVTLFGVVYRASGDILIELLQSWFTVKTEDSETEGD